MFELLRTAEVTDLQARLPIIVLSLSIDEDVVGFDISVGDAFTVEVSQSFEELVAKLLYRFEPGRLLCASFSR